ncbi:interleukin-17C [Eucyclogobius newberryi]|uniref:interleukin-17C n=1 Tax=Eucyclogobius newberryi TaxID=166745 RepID=UPI003B5CACDB
MELKQVSGEEQVFVFLLSLAVCMCVHACYDEENLENAARKKLQSHYHQPAFPTQASSAPSSCPLDLYEKDKTLKGRSISPWAYVQKQMPGHFPSTYYEAKCLCSGCILLDDEDEPYESSSYSSAPVIQSRLFLKRELCEGHRGNGTRYSLKPVNKDVTVACTCVQPIVIMAP